MAEAPAPSPTWPWPKRLLFGLITAILSIVIFVGGAELLLRAIGYGHATSLTLRQRDADGQTWIVANRDFTMRYFHRGIVRRPQSFRVAEEKGADEIRILVQGSSAAMGDPEASYSLARMLEVMLHEAYPEKQFMVINLGITAINSHVVRDVAAGAKPLQPDLAIVYEGHNEVIGPYGPAGVLTPFLDPAMIRLHQTVRTSRLGQAMGDVLAQAPGAQGEDAPGEWAGMAMFLDQAIAADDPRLEAVQRNFADNLRAIVRANQQAGAPTLLCTVLTNQRDFAPFLSAHRADLSEADLARWQSLVDAGDAAWAQKDVAAAEQAYLDAWQIDSTHADLAFKLGRLLLAQNEVEAAQAYLSRALDLDTLRFRTDAKLQAIIREVGESTPDATFVDIARQATSGQPVPIAGDDLLYEHVHLSFAGTFRVADVLFPSVVAELTAQGRLPESRTNHLTVRDLQARLAYTPYDQGMIAQLLVQRFASPPFTSQRDAAFRQQLWQERAARIHGYLQNPAAPAQIFAAYDQAVTKAPGDWVLWRNYGMALRALGGDLAKARACLEHADALIGDDVDTLLALRGLYSDDPADPREAALRARIQALEPRAAVRVAE